MEGQFLSVLIDGSKLIESRFYKVRAAPIGKIKRNDLIVFKQVGKPLFAVGVVAKALSGSLDRKALTFVKANADDIGIDQKPPSLVSLGEVNSWLSGLDSRAYPISECRSCRL
jgi:hypothetical protein